MGFRCQIQERRLRKFSKNKLLERVKTAKYVFISLSVGTVFINSIYLRRLLMDESVRSRLKR